MIHSGEKPHKCSTCGKSFRRSDALHCHQKTHRKETDASMVEPKTDAVTMVPTYTLSEITYNDSGNPNHMHLENVHVQSQQLMNQIGQNDIGSITVVCTQQTDIGDQNVNTFNFIL